MALWPSEDAFDRIIASASTRYDVPFSLIKGVIAAESAFKPDAYRAEPQIEDASRGLMQVLRSTADTLGFRGSDEGLFEPWTNINLGVQLLSRERARTGSWDNAISAYNGGVRPSLGFGSPITRSGVSCGGRTVPVGEYCNQKYVDKVKRFWHYFETGEIPPQGGATLIGLTVAAAAALAALFFVVPGLSAGSQMEPVILERLIGYIDTAFIIGIAFMAGDHRRKLTSICERVEAIENELKGAVK